MRRATLLAVIGITAVLASLPAAGSSPGVRRPGAAQKRPDCSGVSDETIRNRVLEVLRDPPVAFGAAPYLEAVVVRGGVVRVSGAVASSRDWRLLEDFTKNVPCVRDVELGGLDVSCATIAAADNARRALDGSLPCAVSSAIKLTARDGRITLTGTVPLEKDARNAEEVAGSVDYVEKVSNRLMISSPQAAPLNCQTVTDEQLRAAVESAIRSKFSCAVLCFDECVRVGVRNRVVTLTGLTTPEAKPGIVQTAQSVPCVTQAIATKLSIPGGPGCTGGLTCRDASGLPYCYYGGPKCPRIE